MVKKRINFILPDSNYGYTHTKVFRSVTGKTGAYSEITSSDCPQYDTTKGVPITISYAIDLNSADSYWYYIQFYDFSTGKVSDISDKMIAMAMRGYATVQQVRDYTNVQSAEYSDAAVQMLIDQVTSLIDQQTGRTWQGVQTVTDQLLFTDPFPGLTLPRGDIVSITSLYIDWQAAENWELASPSYYYVMEEQGIITLKPNATALQHNRFPDSRPARNRTVKISYTWGKDTPTSDVQMLCILQVAQMMKTDATRYNLIAQLKTFLTRTAIMAP